MSYNIPKEDIEDEYFSDVTTVSNLKRIKLSNEDLKEYSKRKNYSFTKGQKVYAYGVIDY